MSGKYCESERVGRKDVPEPQNLHKPIATKIREIPIPDQSGFGFFYNIFVKIRLMGWIRIGFALLNTLYKCKIHRFFYFFESAFESGLLFLRERALFSNLSFFLIFAKPLYQNVRIDHRIILFFS